REGLRDRLPVRRQIRRLEVRADEVALLVDDGRLEAIGPYAERQARVLDPRGIVIPRRRGAARQSEQRDTPRDHGSRVAVTQMSTFPLFQSTIWPSSVRPLTR